MKKLEIYLRPTCGEGYIIPITTKETEFRFAGKDIPLKRYRKGNKIIVEVELTKLLR